MRNGLRVYDAHAHIGAAHHSGWRYSAGDLLRDMDRGGVDRALAIPFPVVEDFRQAHDEIGRAVSAHRDRLSGAACLPAYLPEPVFRDELRRVVETYGFTALKFQPQYQPMNPVSPRTAHLFEAALELGLVFVAHTGAGVPFALPSAFMLPARRYPELPLVLAHAGGGLFFQEAIVAASFCPNIYLELSTLLPHQVAEVVAQVPSSRLMIGSDLPANLDMEIGKISEAAISNEARADILWNTASRLFDGSPR